MTTNLRSLKDDQLPLAVIGARELARKERKNLIKHTPMPTHVLVRIKHAERASDGKAEPIIFFMGPTDGAGFRHVTEHSHRAEVFTAADAKTVAQELGDGWTPTPVRSLKRDTGTGWLPLETGPDSHRRTVPLTSDLGL